MEPIDCAWAWVRSLKDAFDDPFTAERGMVFTDADGNRHVGPPIKFRDEPPHPNPDVPGFGEHSEELAASIGLNAEAIASLKAKGTI